MRVPAEIPVSVVAKACGCSRKAARGKLRRAGILERLGAYDVVRRSRLRETLPDTYEDVFALYELGDDTVPNRARV